MSFFLILNITCIFQQFVMILPLYLVFINIILMPLKYKYIAPTKYLQGSRAFNLSVFFSCSKSTLGQSHRNKTTAETVSFFSHI